MPGRDDEDSADNGEIVIIRTFADSISAHIAQAALDANDIRSIIVGDDAGGAYPALTFSNGVRLAVKHSDAVRALRLLDSEQS
jgi:putative signal transducing protein